MADVRNYATVTGAYWAFTLSDGALRMLVLLHFHRLGYAPVDLAFLFLLYEFMGVVTNFFGGWIGSRYGLRVTLFAGLAIQVFALVLLSAMDPGWTLGLSVAYVMTAQALSGVAKDLTKMSSKSAVKLVVKDHGGQGLLFRWVSLLTGSKNALKGLGFFIGGFLLQEIGFRGALWIMAAVLAVVLLGVVIWLKADLGKAKKKIRGSELLSKSREINLLSAARVFLFASRDVWFVVGVPVYLASVLGWSFEQVGSFMAAWVIGYGIIQAAVPKFLARAGTAASGAKAARNWAYILAVLPAAIALILPLGGPPGLILIVGLLIFGGVFAVNSALHSYLIVAYSDSDKIALNVGFYYMANAWGRLAGTLLSGVVYQMAGLGACLWVSSGMILASALIATLLPTQRQQS